MNNKNENTVHVSSLVCRGMDIPKQDNLFSYEGGETVMNVKVFPTSPHSRLPEYGTGLAACFDLRAVTKGRSVKIFNPDNSKFEIEPIGELDSITIRPNERALVPTGLIFDIPDGYSLRLLPRSGTALKFGITLTNCTGVIDEDFFHETHVILHNTSESDFDVLHLDRICQAEFVKSLPQAKFTFSENAPSKKSDRDGGLGHTGSK